MSENPKENKFFELAGFKAIDTETGGFKGYGNNFGVLDDYDDITLPGAFASDLKEFIDSGFGGVDHSWGIKSELGIVMDAFEDATGLFLEIGYHPTDDAQMVRSKINNRLSNKKKVCLSIGYRTKEVEYVVGEEAAKFLINPPQAVLEYLKEHEPLVRLLKKIKLYEVSPVSVGANGDSQIQEAKSSIRTARREIQRSNSNFKKLQILNLNYEAISL